MMSSRRGLDSVVSIYNIGFSESCLLGEGNEKFSIVSISIQIVIADGSSTN